MTKQRSPILPALVRTSAFLALIGGCSVHEHDLTLPDAHVGGAADSGNDTSSTDGGSPGRDAGANDTGGYDEQSTPLDSATYDATDAPNDAPARDSVAEVMTPSDGGLDAVADSAIADADGGSPVGDDIWAVGSSSNPVRPVVIHWTQQTKWELQTTPDVAARLQDVWGTDRSNVWAVGNGLILHYDGSRWTSVTSPTTEIIRAVWGSSRNDVWAIGYDNAHGKGFVIRYDGNSWQSQGVPSIFTNVSFSGIWGTGPRDIWIAGQVADAPGGKLFHLNAVGNWEDMTPATGVGEYLSGVWTSSSTSGWSVGSGGLILQLSESTWTAVTPPATTSNLKAVTGLSSGEVWAIGWFNSDLNTQILRYGGTSWAGVPLGTTEENTLMNDVFVRSARDVWFAGFNGVVLHYDGMTVTADATVPTQAILGGIWGVR